MSASIALQLFGVPAYEIDGTRAVFTTERPFQLLCYLACRRHWVRRDELAEILWPEHDSSQARSNLRKVLLLAGRIPGVDIERQGDLLRWRPDSDLAQFEEACRESRFAEATELATRPLLEGFENAFSGAGAAWLRGEQQRVASQWQSACLQQLGKLVDRPAAAGRLARLMLARDPFDEAAISALARGLLALGEHEAAAREIASYAQRLHDELGVDLSAALRELALSAAITSRPMLHAEGAWRPERGFIGRHAELQELIGLVERADFQLLTLSGPGGIGKTSIAAKLALRLAPEIVEAVVMVPLSDLTEASQVPARLAACIGTTLNGEADAWTQVAAAIGQRSLALVLDNAEHLVIADRLGSLLSVAPRLRLIVTSRARLGLASETLFVLGGLPLPDDDETDIDVLRHCDSVALFEARALVALRSFDLAEHAAAVVRLVHCLEGLPLAIELAANWTRLLPVVEIVDEIERSVELLEGGGSERSMRASFAQSWRLLSPMERQCLPKLAHLPGDFGREMALQVAGTSLPVLAALVDKSLLRSDGNGRFSMHALLARCARESVGSDETQARRHAAFVAQWLGAYSDSHVAITPQAMADIERDLPHVRAAWAWALQERDAAVFAATARAFSMFCEARGMLVEGITSFSKAATTFADRPTVPARTRAVVWRGLATLQHRRGDHAGAVESAQHVMELARGPGDGDLVMAALNTLGNVEWQHGRFEAAVTFFEQALDRALQEGHARAVAVFSGNVAMIEQALGRYERALETYERILATDRRDAHFDSLARTLYNVSIVDRALGRPDRALLRLEEAIVLCTQHGLHALRPFVTVELGLNYIERGDPQLARSWLERSLAEARQRDDSFNTMVSLLALARIDTAHGATGTARDRIWGALTLADRLESAEGRVKCVVEFGAVLIREARTEDGVTLLRWAEAQPAFDQFDRDIRRERVQRIFASLSETAILGRRLAPDTPVASLLALVAADPH